MTALAVIQWKSNGEMTGAAELSIQDIAHFEMLGSFLLHIENIGMAIGAVVPLLMRFMREVGGRDHIHFGLQLEQFFEWYGFILFVEEAFLGSNPVKFHCFSPVDAIAVARPGLETQTLKAFLEVFVDTVIVTFFAVFPGMPKSNIIIVAGATELAMVVGLLGDSAGVGFHHETQLEVTHVTGVIEPVSPMGEADRCLPIFAGQVVDQDIAVLRRRGMRRQIEILGGG